MSDYAIEAGASNDTGPCSCCGNLSRTITGFVYGDVGAVAAYFVHWTLHQVPRHGANFDIILGRWGEGALPEHRVAISLAFRQTESGPAFMVIDASSRPVGSHQLVGTALARTQVVGTPIAKQAFAIVDAIWLQDARIQEIVHGKPI